MTVDLSKITDDAIRAEIQTAIDAALDEATKGLFTQSQLDRRVNDAVQKQIKSNKDLEAEIRKAIEDEAKLNAEQKAEKILAEAEKLKNEALTLQNKATAMEKCVAAGITKDDAEPMLNVLVNSDATKSTELVDLYVKQYEALVAAAKADAAKNMPKPPTGGGGEDVVTKEKFDKMTFSEQVAFKNEHPEEAARFMKI